MEWQVFHFSLAAQWQCKDKQPAQEEVVMVAREHIMEEDIEMEWSPLLSLVGEHIMADDMLLQSVDDVFPVRLSAALEL